MARVELDNIAHSYNATAAIRMEDGIPRGSSISRGGDANGPAAVYATTKFVE